MLAVEHRHQCFEVPLEKDVVRVAEGDEVPARRRDATVPGRADAAVLLLDEVQRPIVCTNDCGGCIGRAVVDDDQLEVAICLREHRLDPSADGRFGVVRRHDDGDPGTHAARS